MLGNATEWSHSNEKTILWNDDQRHQKRKAKRIRAHSQAHIQRCLQTDILKGYWFPSEKT